MPTQRAHKCRLSWTNQNSVIAVCACDWIGAAHTAGNEIGGKTRRSARNRAMAEQAAVAEYETHVRSSGPLTATLDPSTHADVLINTRRFGHS